MASESKRRKCKNTAYDRGGEKGKIRHFKGYAMYHKKDRVAANKEAVIDEEDIIEDIAEYNKSEILKHLDALMICVGNAYNTSHYLLESDMEFIEKQEKIIKELLSDKLETRNVDNNYSQFIRDIEREPICEMREIKEGRRK